MTDKPTHWFLRLLAGLVLTLIFTLVTTGLVVSSGLLEPTLITDQLVLAVATTLALLFLGLRLEHRAPRAFGFPRKRAIKGLAFGVGVGAGAMVITVIVMSVPGWYRVLGTTDDPLGAFTTGLVFYTLVAVAEEVMFRGMIHRIVEERFGTAVALTVGSLLFGALHIFNPDASLGAVLGIALAAGILIGASYTLTGGLWAPIGIHFAWNFTQGTVFDLSVSGTDVFDSLLEASVEGPVIFTGGGFGPEAGLVAVASGLGLGLWLVARTRREGSWRSPRTPEPS